MNRFVLVFMWLIVAVGICCKSGQANSNQGIKGLDKSLDAVVVFNSGIEIEGKVVENTDEYIKLLVEDLELTFSHDEIKQVLIKGKQFFRKNVKKEKISKDSITQKVIKDIQRKTGNIKSYKCDVIYPFYINNNKIIVKKTMLYKKPDYMRIESVFENPLNISSVEKEKQITIFDGKILWQYSPQKNIVFITNREYIDKKMGGDGYLKMQMYPTPLWSDMFSDTVQENIRYLHTKTINGDRVYVLEFSPLKGVSSIFNIRVKDGMCAKIKIEGEKETTKFKNIQTNIDIPEGKFRFIPPKGVEIKTIEQEMKKFGEELDKGMKIMEKN